MIIIPHAYSNFRSKLFAKFYLQNKSMLNPNIANVATNYSTDMGIDVIMATPFQYPKLIHFYSVVIFRISIR